MIPATPEAYDLLREGSIAFAEIEANGIRIDTKYLNKAIKDVENEILTLEQELRNDKVWKLWTKRFGQKAVLGNRRQLGAIVFDVLGFDRTKGNNDEEAFNHVDHSFVKTYFLLAKKQKMRGTYLENIRREVDANGFLHPVFNLNTVSSYRSSGELPNWQNIPVRDPVMGKPIRTCVIARKNSVLVENDFGGIEVRGIACYCKDPVLIDYIKDPTKDMHRDMASECYCLPVDQVNKHTRYCAKNKFVFPEFYGSYYVDCAAELWQAILDMGLQTNDGVPIGDVLAKRGIKELGDLDPNKIPKKGTFERHIKEVEERFWNKFHVYAKWRRDVWSNYLECGYVKTLTGFVLRGIMRRNQVINMANQGSSFHLLLKSLIILLRRMRKLRMRSKVIGQIHDSILADVRVDELNEYLSLVKEVTTVVVPKLWKWIIVPLEIEAEVCPEGGSWYDKKQVEFPK